MKISPEVARWLTPLAAGLIRFVGATLRVKVHDEARVIGKSSSNGYLFACWHNRILMMPYFYKKLFPGRHLAVMISRSRDGQIISDIVEQFGIQAVRGSSSKKAAQAYRQLLRELTSAQKDVAVTPDGPRGPRYQAHPGVIALAQMSGYKILPITCHYEWKIECKSWDGFQIPLPFSPCDFYVMPPIRVDGKIDAHEKAKLVVDLEDRLGI
ncbi:MAG: lysophospholipid acyltransferase family protein [Verrucomicrobiota bacterium]